MIKQLINKIKLFGKEAEQIEIEINDKDLLPCPFCDGKALVEHNLDFDDTSRSGSVFTRRIICYECHIGTLYFIGGNEKRMIDKWNKRVSK